MHWSYNDKITKIENAKSSNFKSPNQPNTKITWLKVFMPLLHTNAVEHYNSN